MSDALREQLQYLPDYLSRHLTLTVSALVLGITISMPLGLLATRMPRLRGWLLGITSIVQTIPGLAMLAYMSSFFSLFGFAPALITLVLYSILPILRNTVTGVEQVDERVVDAARGIGMTPKQILLRVQLPLALPVIIAGVRTATVWTVGLATIATPIGATSLGNYIFSGIQTRNDVAITLGCFSAAILALVLDGLVGQMESGARQRNWRRIIVSAVILVAVFGAGIAPQVPDWYRDFAARFGGDESNRIIVGAKGFTEQFILAEVLSDQLVAAGFDVEVKQSLGSTVVFEALASNDIACYVDYSGTIWANHMNRDDNPGAEAVLAEMTAELREKYNIETVGALGFENAYALAVRGEDARNKRLQTLDDLAEQAADMTMGADYEFYSRPEWFSVRDTYGIEFEEQKSFDPALMYSAVADGEVDVISAFSTDGRIAAYELAVLDDPRNALPPYDAVLLVSPEAARNSAIIDALAPLMGAITDDIMREANKLVDVDGGTVREAADYILESIANAD